MKYEDCYVEEENKIFTIGFNDDQKSIDTIKNIIFLEFAVDPGEKVEKGNILLSVEVMKGTYELKSRVSGKVIEVNREVEDEPEILQDNPSTWLIRIRS